MASLDSPVTDSAAAGFDYFTRNTKVFDLMVNAAGINKNMALIGQ